MTSLILAPEISSLMTSNWADEGMHRNWMTLGTVKTGAKVFIGNEAVVPLNYSVESGALIGVKSRPPEGGEVKASETWFGSPSIKLPCPPNICCH